MKKSKKILLSFIMLFAISCSSTNQANEIQYKTLTHEAYFFYGLHEVEDRQLIKQIMGVDPVTTEWCAAFVNMILLEQNLPTSNPHPLMAQSFLNWGVEVDTPKQGDIIVFSRGNQGWQGHVGFYVSTTIVDNVKYYNILGGNQSNAVTIEPYRARSALSIRRLKE